MVLVLGLIAGASMTLFSQVPAGAAVTTSRAPSATVRSASPALAHVAVPVFTTAQTVQVGDVTRDYLLGGAPIVSGVSAPLLVLFHGLDQETTDFLGDVNILTAAAQAGVVVAAPESPDDSWNDGRFGADGADDDSFAMAVISQLASEGVIDPTRVTVAGFSNGAGMAIELAARHPAQIAALVSVDGEILSGTNQTLPSGPIPAYFIHGTDDSVQPLDGRLYSSDRYPGYVSEADTINAFLAVDGDASVTPTQAIAAHHAKGLAGSVTVTQWAQPGGVPVTFASVAGMGHKWPMLACTPLAVSTSLTAKIATAVKTLKKLRALRRYEIRHGGKLLRKRVALLKKTYTKQTKAIAAARFAAAQADADAATAIAAMIPSTGETGCVTGGGANTKTADVSANSMVVGVAATAFQGSYTP